jgi:hypothetical protein
MPSPDRVALSRAAPPSVVRPRARQRSRRSPSWSYGSEWSATRRTRPAANGMAVDTISGGARRPSDNPVPRRTGLAGTGAHARRADRRSTCFEQVFPAAVSRYACSRAELQPPLAAGSRKVDGGVPSLSLHARSREKHAVTQPGPSLSVPLDFRRPRSELHQVPSWFDVAVGGQGSVVVIPAEPGIGKSALCDQLAAYADSHGAHTLVGRCYAASSLSVPYLPVVEALRTHVLGLDVDTLRIQVGNSALESKSSRRLPCGARHVSRYRLNPRRFRIQASRGEHSSARKARHATAGSSSCRLEGSIVCAFRDRREAAGDL